MKTSYYLSLSISIGLLMSLASCQKEELLIPSGPGKIGSSGQVVGSVNNTKAVSANMGTPGSIAVVSKSNIQSESSNLGSPDLGDISKLKNNSEAGSSGSSVLSIDKNNAQGAGVYKVKRRKDLASAL